MEKPIRVLHILQRMEAGGTQALLMNIYRKIDRNTVQFDFLVEYPDKQFYDDEIGQLGGKVYYSTVRKDFNIPKFTKLLKKILTENPEYKIVHVHTYSIGYFCLKAAKKVGVPVRIAHSHNNETLHDFKYLFKRALQKIYTICATDLFACSKEAGKYLFKDKPFQVLKNAIDSEKFIANEELREETRKELGIEGNFIVGHVGRLHMQKNHLFLIDLFAKIKKIRKDAVLILVGTGPLEEKLRNRVMEKGLVDCVIFLGNRKDMNRIYQAMDVFVLPSLFEGLGIVAIEAQATGIPTLCSSGVSSEANISPLFISLDLDQGVDKWADVAISHSNNYLANHDMRRYVVEAGYDMRQTAKYMQDYYIHKYMS